MTAFQAIGVAIGSKREPVSIANKKMLFAFAEQLLKHGSGEVSNTVATCLLEQVGTAAQAASTSLTLTPTLAQKRVAI